MTDHLFYFICKDINENKNKYVETICILVRVCDSNYTIFDISYVRDVVKYIFTILFIY